MKQFSEFLPILIFAGVYFYTRDVFISTAVLMGAVAIQAGYEFATTGKVRKQNLLILASVVILGGMTLIFRNEAFIQWKPTVINWIFCSVLLVTQFFSKHNLLKKMLGNKLHLPDHAWKNLTLGWSLGFFTAGALNLYVAFNFSMDFWVSYKLFGGLVLTFIYIVITMIYLVAGGFMREKEIKGEALEREDA